MRTNSKTKTNSRTRVSRRAPAKKTTRAASSSRARVRVDKRITAASAKSAAKKTVRKAKTTAKKTTVAATKTAKRAVKGFNPTALVKQSKALQKKNVYAGSGISTVDDPYKAGKEAVEMADPRRGVSNGESNHRHKSLYINRFNRSMAATFHQLVSDKSAAQ